MVVACLALFLAATGTGVAVVSSLPAGSVGTPQLKKNAVISIKVKDRSLKAVDFARGQLPRGATGATGLGGAAGPAGATGPGGAAGAQGPAGTARAYAQVVTNDPVNPVFDHPVGFPNLPPRHISTGHLCIPAPAGVDTNAVPIFTTVSGGSFGFAVPTSTNADCRAAEYEVVTVNASNVFTDGILFNVLVP